MEASSQIDGSSNAHNAIESQGKAANLVSFRGLPRQDSVVVPHTGDDDITAYPIKAPAVGR